MYETTARRRYPGAEPLQDGTLFTVWAPKHERLSVQIDSGDRIEMERGQDGVFTAASRGASAGTRYQFRTTDGRLLPDPATRYQPEGPHGPSQVVDATTFAWSDADWRGPGAGRHVVYEMHIGTFTQEGTWDAAARRLEDLADLGVTIIEVMPVAEFAGRFNWGYDGVAPFAPSHVYGTPDDMRRFVDRAHALGLAVILDVVYNHMGPDGCYMAEFADEYFSRTHTTDWGPALNFDGPGSARVREYFLANVEYWIRDFHLDGLRFDATQNIYDTGPRHIMGEMVACTVEAAAPRRVWNVAENEPQQVAFIRSPDAGGYGMDALWNDDFHHSAYVALTGRREAYHMDYTASPQELISCARYGFLYQGQHYRWQDKRRGTSTRDVPARAFVNCIQNHDQIANSVAGRRIHELTSPGALRAMTAFMLLAPGTPMLFQGQEFTASAPFMFFADHKPDLAEKVHAGRREFLAQFPSMALPDVQRAIEDPSRAVVFERCRLDHRERESNADALRLHRDLIRLSRTDPAFARNDARFVDGAVLGDHALVLRFAGNDADDRLLIMNLGADLRLDVVSTPLVAEPAGARWQVLLATEDPRYGGHGAVGPVHDAGWLLAARSATVLAAVEAPAGGARAMIEDAETATHTNDSTREKDV